VLSAEREALKDVVLLEGAEWPPAARGSHVAPIGCRKRGSFTEEELDFQ
jgi:hypothetical protein